MVDLINKKVDEKKIIPIVFAVDDNYAPFLAVTVKSILNTSKSDSYFKFYVLNTGISKPYIDKLSEFNTEKSDIEFIDVAKRMHELGAAIHLRDYYTQAIYYRIFIPELFPQYDKILYLDSDIVLIDDVANLYNIDLGDNIIGAIPEEVMTAVEVFGEYSEKVIGVPRGEYFNSGLLLINCKKYKEEDIEGRFIKMMQKVKFEVAPDQDYLNVLCHGKVKLLELGWNKAPIKKVDFDDKTLKLIHYKLWYKPWLYADILYENYFWDTASQTNFYEELKEIRASYGEDKIFRDILAYKKLMKMAHDYIQGENQIEKYFRSLDNALGK